MSDLMCPVRVLAVRHAAAEGASRLAGDDRPLSAEGRRQAAELADRLASERVAAVYTSPLLRARQTADVLGAPSGAPVKVEDRLCELTAGSAIDRWPDPADAAAVTATFRHWLDGDLDRRAGAAETGAETGAEVVGRLAGVLNDIADLHRGETVVLVTHDGILALGAAVLVPGLSPRWVAGHPLGSTDVVELEYDGDGWRCTAWAGSVPR